MAVIRPFKLNVPDKTLNDIRNRVLNYPWHEMPDDGGWNYGTNLEYIKEICSYWVEQFDWQKSESEINKFSHFKTVIDGIDTHFIHEKGSGDRPTRPLISHVWPGSVAEFTKIIEPLAHPERFGGDIKDAFNVVAPSLPGFGFSSRPPRPYGPRKIAHVFNELMSGSLEYSSYLAQGGDWGGAISSWLGFDHSGSCKGIHINILSMRHPDGPKTKEEKD
jgi:hypothetical protein